MEKWNWFQWTLFVILILILIYIFSPSVRSWVCSIVNTKFKKQGSKCKNCDTSVRGIITDNGNCVPEVQVAYDTCVQTNAAMKDGSDCIGCGSDPDGSLLDDFSGKGVVINGKCSALPDAFAGKLCVPASATVSPSALSYKIVIVSGQGTVQDPVYQYFKNDGNAINQGSTSGSTEISKDDYVQAYVQTIKACPAGQVKV